MIKTAAAFIQNAITPLADKTYEMIQYLEKHGVEVDRNSIRSAYYTVVTSLLTMMVVKGVIAIIITVLICLTALQVL